MNTPPRSLRLFVLAQVPLAVWAIAGIAAAALPGGLPEKQPKKQPNIVWIVSEDNGPFLGCYGCADANTPNLDRLATEGVLYRNAFANAPVCAPARCTIITGMYATSLGTHNMRSSHPVGPERVRFFPHYLRRAGYFCTNHSKTDYNLAPYQKEAWDMMTRGDHTKRAKDQPFFAVYNIGTSHESSLHTPVDPAARTATVSLPPYHPDTPEIRANWAMYHKIVTRMDQQVGAILKRLEREGVADDTIVFYYSDHGGILPRSKRFLYDTGVHVPMIVRFGRNVAGLAPQAAGSKTDRLVSFVDLAPTVLSLAGIGIPEHMQGRAFLGPAAGAPREYVYCFRGRMDEKFDMSRAVRDARYKYIRNYYPHQTYGEYLEYLWKMPATRSWEAAYKAGKCKGPQRFYWERKPPEELYDTSRDPWEVRNLADDPKAAGVLARMRRAHREHVLRVRDAGYMPEGEMLRQSSADSPMQLVRDERRYPLARLFDAAEFASSVDADNVPRLAAMLRDELPAVRFWGAIGCVALGEKAAAAKSDLLRALDDESPDVRTAAAEALLSLGEQDRAVKVLARQLHEKNEFVAVRAFNVLERAGTDVARAALPDIREAAKRKDKYVLRCTKRLLEILGE